IVANVLSRGTRQGRDMQALQGPRAVPPRAAASRQIAVSSHAFPTVQLAELTATTVLEHRRFGRDCVLRIAGEAQKQSRKCRCPAHLRTIISIYSSAIRCFVK